MIIDGKALAAERIQAMHHFVQGLSGTSTCTPKLIALTASPTAPTKQFLKIKQRVAEEIGIAMEVYTLSDAGSMDDALAMLQQAITESQGVVIQLPFPPEYSVDALLALLPYVHDPDAIGVAAGVHMRTHETHILPPVASAIRLLCRAYNVSCKKKTAVVVGQGRLVGAPVSVWLEGEGAEVVRLTRQSPHFAEEIARADIIVLGAGSPGLLVPHMVKEGVIIFDAGTSEDGGKVVGDADPACAEKASLFTPVPGGIGPLAVAELFANLLRLQFDYPL